MNPAIVVPMLLVLAAGGMISLQAPTNAMLARAGGSPVLAALISFAVGTVVLLGVWLASGSRPRASSFAGLPPYAWFGGAYGALYVAVAAYAAPKIGLAVVAPPDLRPAEIKALVRREAVDDRRRLASQ